jgi:uncharacterized protein (DUF58 family)
VLPSDIIKKVRRLEIRTRHLVTDSVTGAYHSSFKGRGMDFEEVREYAIGDDVRTIDWNVSAKMDKAFVKVFREERELTLMLVVDLSASGDFGSVEQSKRERAAEIASVLAFSATLNNDKVGLILYTDQVELYLPPKKGRRHVLRVIRDILYFEPKSQRTDHKAALDYLNRVQRRKAVVFLISDFINSDPDADPEALPKTLSLTNQRHDLVSIALSDPRESELPAVGLLTIEDAETGEIVEIDTQSATMRQAYAKYAGSQRIQFEDTLRKKGLDWISVQTDQPYMPELRKLFARRASRY